MPPYAPGQTTGFVSIPDYLSANQGTLDREAGDVNGLIGSELDSAKSAADSAASNAFGKGPGYTNVPGYGDALAKQNTAQQDVTNTHSQGGLQDLLGRAEPRQHATGFDALLLGAHGGFGDVQHRGQTLHDYLNSTAGATASQPASRPIDNAPTSRPGLDPMPPPVTEQQPVTQNPSGTPPYGGRPQGQNPWSRGR